MSVLRYADDAADVQVGDRVAVMNAPGAYTWALFSATGSYVTRTITDGTLGVVRALTMPGLDYFQVELDRFPGYFVQGDHGFFRRCFQLRPPAAGPAPSKTRGVCVCEIQRLMAGGCACGSVTPYQAGRHA